MNSIYNQHAVTLPTSETLVDVIVMLGLLVAIPGVVWILSRHGHRLTPQEMKRGKHRDRNAFRPW